MKSNLRNGNTTLLALLVATGIIIFKVTRRKNNYSFNNKVVLITGGSRGLGLVLSRKLASEGANLAICARNMADLEGAKKELERYPVKVEIFTCDISEKAQVEQMVDFVTKSFGNIDVLINNAGTIQVGPSQLLTTEDYQDAHKSIFWGTVNTTLAVLPKMRKKGNGRIINISSIGGKLPIPHLLPYSTAKFAVTAFSEGLRSEVKQDGITITTVIPGLMRTGSHRNALVKGQHEKEYSLFTIMNALPFFSVSAESAAGKILYASRNGKALLTFPLYVKLAIRFYNVFPGFVAKMLRISNDLLPTYIGAGNMVKKGYESQTTVTKSVLAELSNKASLKNNEMGHRVN